MIVDDKGIKDSWKEYMEKLMNEENEWDHKISVEVKEGLADCIRMDEVRAVPKKMKRIIGAGSRNDTSHRGTQWILDLCNGIVKEGSIPEDWKSSVLLPLYKGKGDPMECGSYRGIKLLEHAMKVVERIFEHRIRQQIEIDHMQLEPLMPFLWQDRCRRILEIKVRNSILVLWIWRKLLIGFQEK